MGLDMYLRTNSKSLSEKVHEGNRYGEHLTPWYRKSGIILYWRKANAIHAWFVDNIQYEADDCGVYEVGIDDLVRLHDTCLEVLESTRLVDGPDGKKLENPTLAMELLPTRSGFFFGSTAYDQWYWEDLERTVDELGRIIDMVTPDEEYSYRTVFKGEPDWYVKFYYEVSW